MKRLLSRAALAVVLFSSQVSADEASITEGGEALRVCAIDQEMGFWDLTLSEGRITGYRDWIDNDCWWSVTGFYDGSAFILDLRLTAGFCCPEGRGVGKADMDALTADGLIKWSGWLCTDVRPAPYHWYYYATWCD